MRRMIAGLCLLALPLASCGDRLPLDSADTRPRFDLCQHAAIRRPVYVAAIAAADAYAASGRLVPTTIMLGREAAATALAVLNVNCALPNRPAPSE